FFMLAAIALCTWKSRQHHESTLALNVCRVIVASTYFWSGLQKLNATFIREAWPDVSRSLSSFLPAFAKRVPSSWALLIPLLEIAIAIGLVTRRFRKPFVILAVATHLSVLALLVASGENTVVWPWNIAMATFVTILFWRDRETNPLAILVPSNAFHGIVLL